MAEKLKQENYVNVGGMNTKISPYTTGPTEFLNIRNFDFTVPGALTQRPGSTLYVGATLSGRITGVYEFNRLTGASYLIVTANTNAYTATSGGFNVFRTSLSNGALFDFVTFVDRLFAANGSEFFKFDGSNATNFGMPAGSASGLASAAVGTGGFTGIYTYYYGFLNDRGVFGGSLNGLTVAAAGVSAIALSGFTLPTGYGITATVIYRTGPNGFDAFEIGYLSGSTFLDINSSLGTRPINDAIWFTLSPKYLELYNNQLMMAGFSGALSTVWFSQVAEPELVEADFNFEVRTNDGDKITGLRTYGSNLLVFKKNSFHQLTGDSAENFLLSEVSAEYGCLSNRAIVRYEDVILFLSQKGICEFNGANVRIISNKIESIFRSMNIAAAEENAVGVHDQLRNEIKFIIPCDGATVNNCMIVYDYLADAWAVWDIPQMSSMTIAKREFDSERVFFGSYTGAVFCFGTSLLSDFSSGFTTVLKTRFHSETGKSIEQLYRRLFLDVKPITGQTSPITVNFYADYGVTSALTRTMYANPFQSRIDYGIPAKSLSVEFWQSSTSGPLTIYGYTIESREQRRV